ncbi:hypothetical protein [uncultured Ruegeria sp.]|uniref:hypothetical protein n=1 Tax=uncultured Ruegeria sp. TaxID=259304 RepID=UPI0026108E2D|nr:hypothetical protein [uncultured Ruegeria sp.]
MTDETKGDITAKKKEPSKTGVKFEGSNKEGNIVELTKHDGLREVFGTDCDELASALMAHCLKALNNAESGSAGEVNDERAFMISIIHDIAPRDAVERMLAVQMAATHVATIRSARWLGATETIPQAQLHYTGFNKLSRTFAAQVETLRKHRNGGKQTVTVQHVNVEDGGQAIVGNVETGGGKK